MANIKLNNNEYPIPESKLAHAKTDLIAHLGTIAGSGLRVVIDGVEYNVDLSKISSVVSGLEAVLGELNVGGGDVSLAAGLYQTGAIALYDEQGAEAVEGMLIKSWDELVAEGAVHVDNGNVYTNIDMNNGANSSADVLVGDLVLPNEASIANISECAFASCSNLTGIIIPDGVTNIGMAAFSGCSSLEGVVIPDGVTNISEGAFNSCSSLESVVIPDSVTSIGQYAFYGCGVLSSIIIPSSVKTISYEAFGYCVGLANATIAEGVECIGEYAFNYSFRVGFTPGSSALYLPSTITEIQRRAFSQTALTDVYYNGTCDQFRAINKAGDFFYYNSIVVIHCTDGDYDWT